MISVPRQVWHEARGELARRNPALVPKPSLNEFCERTLGFELDKWQRDVLIPTLQRFNTEKGLRILFHAPPQKGKSIIASRRFPAWLLGMKPLERILVAAYNEEYATESFGEQLRLCMWSDDFVDMFPDPGAKVARDESGKSFSTHARKSLMQGQHSLECLGLSTGFTGKGLLGGGTLIIDDPYRNYKEAFSKTTNENVWSFWNNQCRHRIDKETNVLVMFHRYHEDDLAARLIAEPGSKWEYIRLPAIMDENLDGSDPTGRKPGEALSERDDLAELVALEAQDPAAFLALHQGQPRPTKGLIFDERWFQMLPFGSVPRVSLWVRFWDLNSMKVKHDNDYTAGALVGVAPNGALIIAEVKRFRAEWPETREIMQKTAKEDIALIRSMSTASGTKGERAPEYYVAVEEVTWQTGMLQDLAQSPVLGHQKGIGFHKVKYERGEDKKVRAYGWAYRASNDQLYLVNTRGDWQECFKTECLNFTGVEGVGHDDQVDAVSGAYKVLRAIAGDLIKDETIISPNSLEFWKEFRNASDEDKEKDEQTWNESVYDAQYTEGGELPEGYDPAEFFGLSHY